jgi:hypothetical protein
MSELAGEAPGKFLSFQRHETMARLLLKWTIWAIFAPAVACVLPVAPDFQDPLKAPNYYPYFQSTDPIQESIQTPQTLHASVGDQNLGDTLYVRWVSEYPQYVQNLTKVLVDSVDGRGMPYPPAPTGQTEIRKSIDYDIDCKLFAPAQQHRVVVIVSDRPFLMPTTFSGPLRYNLVGPRADGSPTTIPIMAGWNIICPP